VLRFIAYFKEGVVENPTENFRIRPCLIYYYLLDDTIHITEPKVINSGIEQGLFLKRQRVQKEIGKQEFYHWKVVYCSKKTHFG